MTTSGTYNFQSLTLDTIIEEAFERIGISGEKLVPNLLKSARRSLNFILLEWMSSSTNLWTLNTSFLPLTQNQSSYVLDNTINDIIQCSLRTSSRVLGGVASSDMGGVAENAFDDNPKTSCVQTAANGTIAYDYGVNKQQTITFIGINSFVNSSLSLQIKADNNLLLSVKQSFEAGVTYWFDVPAPILGQVYTISEVGGATLNIGEIYFNNSILDTQISNISRYNYYNFPQKSLSGRPSVYYLDRKAAPDVPTLNIWPSADAFYKNSVLLYSYSKMITDAGSFLESPAIPALFYPALTSELSYRLAVKYAPEFAPNLQLDAQRAFLLASTEDSESVAIRITPSWSERY